MEPVEVVVVGAGRAGTGVGLALAESGVPVAFVSRRPVPVIGPVRAFRIGDAAAPRGAVTFVLAVPDARIAEVFADLAARGLVTADSVVGHLSGAMPASVLAAEVVVAGRFSAHPLFSFPPPAVPRRMPDGTVVMIEGDPAGADAAARLFRRVGARVGVIDPAKKPLYHAAAVLGSNLPAVLVWIAAELFKECGVPEPLSTAARLLGSVTSNLVESPGPSALTGPFVRGDAATVAANLAALAAKSPDLEALYRSFGARLADQLREGRILSERTWQTLIETLK